MSLRDTRTNEKAPIGRFFQSSEAKDLMLLTARRLASFRVAWWPHDDNEDWVNTRMISARFTQT